VTWVVVCGCPCGHFFDDTICSLCISFFSGMSVLTLALCARLSWLLVSFKVHIKSLHIIIISSSSTDCKVYGPTLQYIHSPHRPTFRHWMSYTLVIPSIPPAVGVAFWTFRNVRVPCQLSCSDYLCALTAWINIGNIQIVNKITVISLFRDGMSTQ